MNIYLNNQRTLVHQQCSLLELLEQHYALADHMAIALNQQFIPRPLLASTKMQEGDRIDVIVPMQGG